MMFRLFLLLLLFAFSRAGAQNVRGIRADVKQLAGAGMHGRGYVSKGCAKAAAYLAGKLREAGLQGAAADSGYTQPYRFRVHSFPGAMSVRLNKRDLKPGVDFLVDARSESFSGEALKLRRADVRKIFKAKDSAGRPATLSAKGGAMLWRHADTVTRSTFLRNISGDALDAGLYIVPVKGKMTWTVRSEAFAKGATVVYLQDSAIPRWPRRMSAHVEATTATTDQVNVIAKIPGSAVPDSFLVFTAHYDHLGEMGARIIFPGASDNASGTATVLDLARYYSQHPQRYTMVFIFFSGEEAGLKGSEYYVRNPTLPLDHIRFLINLDMVGEAGDGATVVNATKLPVQFAALRRLNEASVLLPKLVERGEAANSDHYHFTQAGVPCFFIYGNGGKGRYHDVFDTAAELSLTGTEDLEKLLIRFVETLQ